MKHLSQRRRKARLQTGTAAKGAEDGPEELGLRDKYAA